MPIWVQMNDEPNALVVRQVIRHANPADIFKPALAAEFTEYPDGTEVEANWIDQEDGTFAPRPAPIPGPDPTPPAAVVSPVEFKLLFTSAERLAIKAFRALDTPETAEARAIIDDWYEILDDPRLTQVNLGLASTIAGVQFLETLNLIGAGRSLEILANTPPS